MARKDKKQAYDYGQVLVFSAVMVSMPRWAGAFIAADVTEMPRLVSEVLHYLNLFSGFGMALLEVLGAAYLLDAWGRMKPRRTHNAKHLDHRWVILTIFVVGLFLLMPLILSPYIVARMNDISVTEIGGPFFDFAWAVAVVMSPVFIIGGAAVARGNSLVGTVQKSSSGSETVLDSPDSSGTVLGTVRDSEDRPKTDWRRFTDDERTAVIGMTPEQIVKKHGVSEKTAGRWIQRAGELSSNGSH